MIISAYAQHSVPVAERPPLFRHKPTGAEYDMVMIMSEYMNYNSECVQDRPNLNILIIL